MRESISYSFVLNMVILFMFVCLAIIAGIFSYYRAFRANTIVINAIEKYEGYNCLSEEESKRKLNTISYNVPFEVNCNNKGGTCMTDTDKNYAVVSYNLDFTGAKYVKVQDDPKKTPINDKYKTMNSTYTCNYYYCTNTKKYQYGVYTYMYIDLPIVSQMIRIPFFSKTNASSYIIIFCRLVFPSSYLSISDFVFNGKILPLTITPFEGRMSFLTDDNCLKQLFTKLVTVDGI